MTLRKQLILMIISLFVLVFIGTFIIHTVNMRDFLISQSETQAQNTASSLGVSITQYPKTDSASIMALIDSVYKTGSYQQIIFNDINNKVLLERGQANSALTVPNWFAALTRMNLEPGNALVMDGWKQFGNIAVYSDTASAYQALWNSTLQTFWWFLAVSIFTIAASLYGLKILLKPLEAVKEQAEAICAKNFELQEKLPKTLELRSVVIAMNKLASKIHDMFDAQSLMIEKLRAESYTNQLTQLGNRRYFNMQMENFTTAKHEFSTGALFLLEVKDLERHKQSYGYQSMENAIQKIANVLKNISNKYSAFSAFRISDPTFTVLAPHIFIIQAEKIAQEISQKLLELNIPDIRYYMGVAIYNKEQSGQNLLSDADHALRLAEVNESGSYSIYGSEKGESFGLSGASQWNNFLQEVIDTQNIILHYQPVFSAINLKQPAHYEVLLRIQAPNQQIINAGIFIPEAESLGKVQELDKLVILKILKDYPSYKNEPMFAINLAPSSIKNKSFIEWIANQLGEHKHIAEHLIFEIPENIAIYDLDALKTAIDTLKEQGCLFSLDHYGRGLSSFAYLKSLDLDFIKIDGSFTHHIQEDKQNQLYIHVMIEIAHSLDIRVVAENVETEQELEALKVLGVDGFQGYLLGKPGSL